jgi:putative ABC transport system substrate-binding protein
MDRRTFASTLGGGLVAASLAMEARATAKPYHVGVVLEGGPYYAMVDGLKEGLKALGFEEGTHYLLLIRDVKGDPRALEPSARGLEQEKVDVIYSLATSVTLAVKRATTAVPIVFYVGTDPVVVGLVKSFAKPSGRLTGVHSLSSELAVKRLEILRDISPKIHRVAAFFDPGNTAARESVSMIQQVAGRLGMEVVERHVRSVEELRVGLESLRHGEVDALVLGSDAMLTSQTKLVVDSANARKLATVSLERSFARAGGLASYGVNFRAAGRQSAKLVQRVLSGTSPAELPIERIDRFELVLNLRTARALGLTVPPSVLARADQVIE